MSRKIPQEQPPVSDDVRLAEWLTRLVININGILDGIYSMIPGNESLSKTAFGELGAEQLRPITQIKAQYGLLQNVLTVTDDLISGTNSVVDDMFTCETGESADGLASILTLRQLTTRAGQGSLARFPAIFNIGVLDNNQAAGLVTAENLLTFGYIGVNFGILYSKGGLDELQELVLSVDSGSGQTASVTIDGTVYPVSLSGGTSDEDAYEIAIELSSVVPNYNFSSNENTVIAQSIIPGPMGSFAYSSSGVSSGSWSQEIEGADGDTIFIPQSQWNHDTRLKGSVDQILNPQLNNMYQIQLNGAADFFIEDKLTKETILVHRISFMNEDTSSNIGNATFRLGWLTRNVGNTSNVIIKGDYASAFNEGQIYYDTVPRSKSNSVVVPADDTSATTVLILRNRLSFGGKINRAEVLPLVINVATESNKSVEFRLILDPVFSSPVKFEYINKESSIIEFSESDVLVTGGLEIGSVLVESGNPQKMEFNLTDKTTTAVYPGSTIAIVATHQSGGAGASRASASFQEDL